MNPPGGQEKTERENESDKPKGGGKGTERTRYLGGDTGSTTDRQTHRHRYADNRATQTITQTTMYNTQTQRPQAQTGKLRHTDMDTQTRTLQ